MLHIVTDGAADLLAGWSKEYCIDSVSLAINFGPGTIGLVLYPAE
jgi:hypothetical protein